MAKKPKNTIPDPLNLTAKEMKKLYDDVISSRADEERCRRIEYWAGMALQALISKPNNTSVAFKATEAIEHAQALEYHYQLRIRKSKED